MSSKNRTTLKSELAIKVPSVTNGVTAANVRSLITDVIDSSYNANDDGSPLLTVNKASVGLPNVDNTSDANKPVSSAQAAAIAAVPTFTPDTPESIAITDTTAKTTARPAGVTRHLVNVTIAAGGSPYSCNLTADLANTPVLGMEMRFVFTFPASANPTVVVKCGGAAPDITITNPLGLAGQATLDVSCTGASWIATLQSDGLGASGVTAGTYGDSTHVASVTFGVDGRATSVSNVALALPKQAVFRLGPGPSLADGVLAKGANIIPDGETYVGLIQNWNTSFPGYLKQRLDLMAANGFNIVRLVSGLGGIVVGDITRSQFQTAMGQFVSYASKVGLYVYITAADVYGGLPNTYDPSLIAPLKAEAVSYAAFLDQFPNVVAIDLFNEFFYDGGFTNGSGLSFSSRAAIALDWSTAVRAVTNIPITWSLPTTQSNGSSAMWNSTAISELAIIAPAIDFVDMHVYYDVVSSDLTNYLVALAAAKPGGIPLLIGECGMSADNSDATRATRLARTGTIVTECKLAGGLVWDLIDNTGPANQNMGIFHHDYTPYTLSLATVRAWPTSLPFVAQSNPSDMVISSNITIYASPTGNDGNNGLSSGAPKTPQGAADYFRDKTILNGVTCVLQLLDSSSYSTALNLRAFYGTGLVIVRGNVSDNAAVTFEAGGVSPCVGIGDSGDYTYQLEHFRMHSGFDYAGPLRIGAGRCIIGNGMFFVPEQSHACHIYVADGAFLGFVDNCSYVVAGGAGQHIYMQKFARAFFGRFNIDFVSAARTFTQFLLIENLSMAEMLTSAGSGAIGIVSGSAVGQRWALNNLAVLKTYSGQDPDIYFPGNSVGAADALSKVLIT